MLLIFLLTPLREGRLSMMDFVNIRFSISTHAPAGGATCLAITPCIRSSYFYSRPCGRGDPDRLHRTRRKESDFYSRPCGRGDIDSSFVERVVDKFLLTPLREGRRNRGC